MKRVECFIPCKNCRDEVKVVIHSDGAIVMFGVYCKKCAEQGVQVDLGKAQEGRDTGEGFGPFGNRPNR